MTVAIRAKAIAVLTEVLLISQGQDLGSCLLDDPVSDRWDSQRSLFAIWLRYIHPSDRVRTIFLCTDGPLDCHSFLLEKGIQCVNALTVYTSCTLVPLHVPDSFIKILIRQYPFNQFHWLLLSSFVKV